MRICLQGQLMDLFVEEMVIEKPPKVEAGPSWRGRWIGS